MSEDVEPERKAASRRSVRPPRGRSARYLRGTVIKLIRGIRTVQDRLVRVLGASTEGRGDVFSRMLERNAHEATSYWLQLVVAIGIATLGLVIGSAAVIIGAMLVAPLMSPIIALALGLATGSPFLVLRSAGRILLSIVVSVGGAALITVLLPFHDLNGEIVARTAPTVLDLLIAGFCALAAVYASLRPGSDVAATAAGTSIGISLVPPLCACGYGIGAAMWPVAGGAALLFLTNLVAIIFVGTVAYVAAGFNRVDATSGERDALAKNGNAFVAAAISRRLAGIFESRAGPALRFLMPFVLLASVYFPLRRALDEVAWQVRVRAAVRDSLAREGSKLVQSRVRVERHEVDLTVVLLGKTSDAEAARARLDAAIQRASGVTPRIEVLAIPDAKAMAGLESTLRTSRDPLPLPIVPTLLSPAAQLDTARERLRAGVIRLWPSEAVGEPLAIDLGTTGEESTPLRLRVVHLGAALGADGVESLARSLEAAFDRKVELVDVAIPAEPLARSDGELKFMSRVSAGVRASAAIRDVSVCVVSPTPSQNGRPLAPRAQELADALRDVLAQHPRVTIRPGADWTIRFVRGACAAPPADARSGDAGTPD